MRYSTTTLFSVRVQGRALVGEEMAFVVPLLALLFALALMAFHFLDALKGLLSFIVGTFALLISTPLSSPQLPRSLASLDHRGKRILITGGNGDIGRELAFYFADRGAEVHLLCRNVRKAEKVKRELQDETGNDRIFVEVLDLASFKSVRDFVRRWEERDLAERRIDILFNNAGEPRTARDTKKQFIAHLPLNICRRNLCLKRNNPRLPLVHLPNQLPLLLPPHHPPPRLLLTPHLLSHRTDHPNGLSRHVSPSRPIPLRPRLQRPHRILPRRRQHGRDRLSFGVLPRESSRRTVDGDVTREVGEE